MAAQVLSFFQRSPRYAPSRAPAPADWSQQELAEFYRVEAALVRAGIRLERAERSRVRERAFGDSRSLRRR